jgi:acyl-CoA thioesterase-1
MDIIFSFTRLLLISLFIVSCTDQKAPPSSEQKNAAKDSSAADQKVKTVLFFGNSLTAGYGLDPSEAFPALIQKKIDSLDMPYKVVNAGVSGETSSGGNSRIDWILQQPVDVFVLELGANDGLRGIPTAETKKNLQAITDKVKAKYPEAKLVIAGMQIPPNMGQAYATSFMKLFPELASENNAALIPFLLQGVGGEASLNLQDGIHPTAEGHKILAENVWSVLKAVLQD